MIPMQGQGIGLQGPRGLRGRPRGFQGVKGSALRVPGGYGVGLQCPSGQGVGLQGPRDSKGYSDPRCSTGNQTIISGLQIFLDQRSSKTKDKKM